MESTDDNITKKENTKNENKEVDLDQNYDEDENNLSELSLSSYNSIDNIKLDKMGQYTCDQCSEIPKIINTDIKKKTILIKCKNHGLKELDFKNYLYNALNYNSKNWKCSKCDTIQRNVKESFLYCECGSIFCDKCFEIHKIENHKYSIESDKYDLRCKKKNDHYDNPYKGYCFECHEHFCTKCEEEHNLHTTTTINSMHIETKEIDKIKKLNKEYRSLISYYESLIKLNNLIIYSYENYRDNYYNLYNINKIINNYERNEIIEPLNDIDNKIIIPGDKNCNLYTYMNSLYKLQLKEEETESVEINNKFFDNYDLKVFTQIPLKNLHLLILENNGISKIDCLEKADFPDLVILNLNNNAISDISVLEKVKFVEFQALLLRNNNIKDISVFGKVKFDVLREIDLRDNKIEDIEVIEKAKLELLQCLYLTNNKFDINNQKFKGAKERIDKLIEYEY